MRGFTLFYEESREAAQHGPRQRNALNTNYTFTMGFSNNVLTVTITETGVLAHTQRPHLGSTFYFKVGNYDQGTRAYARHHASFDRRGLQHRRRAPVGGSTTARRNRHVARQPARGPSALPSVACRPPPASSAVVDRLRRASEAGWPFMHDLAIPRRPRLCSLAGLATT